VSLRRFTTLVSAASVPVIGSVAILFIGWMPS